MDRVELANELENLARVANAEGDAARATRLLGAAASLRAMIPVPLPASEQSRYEQIITATRTHLDEIAFALAWAAGQIMTLDEAVTYAVAAG